MKTITDIFKEYLEKYLIEDKGGKSMILNHVCFVTKMHRKASVRKFNRLQLRDPYVNEQRGRREYYGPDVTIALKDVWEAGNEVCGELLFPMINEYIDILIRDKKWKHRDSSTSKLRAMKLCTVKRRVGKFIKARGKRNGISTTSPSHLKRLVPTFSGPWKDLPPGNGQIDTVIHKIHY